jgi:ribosome-associated protein
MIETGPDVLIVSSALSIPRGEIVARMSRSGGPGGQHVNTSSTRVALTWNVKTSAVLTDDQRTAIINSLGGRIGASGTVRVVAQERRSQKQNWILAEERLAELIRKALVVRKARKKTRPTRSAVERRLAEKHLTSRRKRERRERGDD